MRKRAFTESGRAGPRVRPSRCRSAPSSDCLLSVGSAQAAEPGAATPAAPQDGPIDVHGFAEVAFKNAYVTPRGLVVTTNGLSVQPLAGIVLVPYHSDSGFVNSVSLVTGIWNNLDASHNAAYSGVLENESDYFAGVSVKLAKRLELGSVTSSSRARRTTSSPSTTWRSRLPSRTRAT